MRAAVLEAIGRVVIAEVDEPRLESATDVIVDVLATSVCGSDLHLVLGHMGEGIGYVLGHEYVGRVRAVGAAVQEFAVGDRVIGPPAVWCGSCERCRAGDPAHCHRGGVLGSGQAFGGLGGTQAEQLRVPYADRNLVRVPDQVSDVTALGLADALMTGATGARQAGVAPGSSIAVFGCGPIGLMAIHTAAASGATTIIAVDPVPERRELALAFGATHTTGDADPRACVEAATRGRGVDGAVEAVGLPNTFQAALEVVVPNGRVAVLGIAAEPFALAAGPAVLKSVNLWMGLGDVRLQDELMGLLASGALDPAPLFTTALSLDELPALYERLQRPGHGIIKAVIRPEQHLDGAR